MAFGGKMPHVNVRSVFEDLLGKNKKPLGPFITSIDPAVTEIMAQSGFDFVVLDCEHGPLDKLSLLNHVRAAEACGVPALARILENSKTLIQSTLDLGVQGVIVPMVNTAEDARSAYSASIFAPNGTRGMCPGCHAGAYSIGGWAKTIIASDANVLVIPIIETKQALDNLEEIVGVDGIDFFLFGAGDLTADMGLDYVTQLPILEESWIRFRDVVHKAGKYAMATKGIGFEVGADVLVASMDMIMLRDLAESIVKKHLASRDL